MVPSLWYLPGALPYFASRIDLTYWMANRLQVGTAQKQRWLEADITTRLREISAAIRAELALLPGVEPGEREGGGYRN